MKKYLLIFFLLFAFASYAQTPASPNKESIVKDASGTILPYAIWNKLIQTGEYSLRRNTNTSEFVLHALSPEEKIAFAERKKERLNVKPRTSGVFKDGEKFRGEKITDMNGNKFDLKNISDKVYVLNFWFINCPPCKAEIPELNELVKQYKDNKDVVFLAIALDNRYELKEFLKTTPFNYNIVENDNYYTKKYGVTAFPTHVVIGKDGLVKFSTIGFASNTVHWIEKTIKEQLAN